MADDDSSKNRLPLSNFTIVVIVSVLIALGLIALGLFAYSSVDDTEDSQTTNETQTVKEDRPVGDPAAELVPEDIDAELQRLDEDLNQLDQGTFNEDALSDNQLGL